MNYIFSAIFLYFFLGILLYIFQRRIIFNKSGHPGAPQDYNLTKTEEIYIKTEDSLDLLSWYHKGDNSLPLLVYFHGNSFHIGDRAYRIERYIERNWSVLLVSWRGFGGNKGNPTEKNLYKDAEAALKWIKNNTEFKFKDLVIYGESLGSDDQISDERGHQSTLRHPGRTTRRWQSCFRARLGVRDTTCAATASNVCGAC